VAGNLSAAFQLVRAESERRTKLHHIKAQVREFVINNFMFGKAEGIRDDTSFLGEGIIDSTGVLELVTFIEESFDIKVEDEELIPENLDSIMNLAGFLQRKGIQDAQAA
jgi:acyl carrier protein